MAVRKKKEVVVNNNEVMTEESTHGIIPEVVDCESEQKNPEECRATVPTAPETVCFADVSQTTDKVEEIVPSIEKSVFSSDSAPEQDIQNGAPATTKKATFAFTPTSFESVSHLVVSKEAVLSIVCTEKNGKRIAISPKLVLEQLEVEDKVQVAYSAGEKAIILAKNLGGKDYHLHDLANKKVIYNKPLVEYLKKVIGLDFSKVSTHSFTKVDFVEHELYGLMAVVPVEGGDA